MILLEGIQISMVSPEWRSTTPIVDTFLAKMLVARAHAGACMRVLEIRYLGGGIAGLRCACRPRAQHRSTPGVTRRLPGSSSHLDDLRALITSVSAAACSRSRTNIFGQNLRAANVGLCPE